MATRASWVGLILAGSLFSLSALALEAISVKEIAEQVPLLGQIRAGSTVRGRDAIVPYILAGGYTIECDFTSLQIEEQDTDVFIFGDNFFFLPKRATQPEPLQPRSVTYSVPNYENVPPSMCRTCLFKHTAIASVLFTFGLEGTGASISLAGGTQNSVQTETFQVCKPDPPGPRERSCCGCGIP